MSFDLHPVLEAGDAPQSEVWYALSPNDTTGPGARVGSCAVTLTARKCVVMLSGGATPEGSLSDLYVLDTRKDPLTWQKLPSSNLPPRYEHSCFVLGGAVHVFGGAQEKGPCSDMWRYDIATGKWMELVLQGPSPPPRTLYSSCLSRPGASPLVVFGGGAAASAPVDDQNVYTLDQDALRWTCPPTAGRPPRPRQGHACAVVGNRLFVHGGMAGTDIFGDLHVLDLESYKWSSPQVSGDIPPPLAAHGCAVVGNMLYIFGGLSTDGLATDQLYALNTVTLKWKKITPSTPPPPARLDHSMCSLMWPVVQNEGCKPQPIQHATPSEMEGLKDLRMVTVIGAEIAGDMGLSSRGEATNDQELDSTLEELKDLTLDSGSAASSQQSCEDAIYTCIPALFIYGGMDTAGNIHSDCFLIVP